MDDIFTETISFADQAYVLAEPPQPKEIGSGLVKGILGKGGTSIVYEVWNPRLEITRAVKLCRPMHSEQMRRRFENEIKLTAKLNHPNIVEIYAVGEWAGLPYIEMEKIDGQNLKDLMAEHGTFPEVVATAIALTICKALMFAHNHEYTLSNTQHRGVIHCDMKPANIMVPVNGGVKLMDFGIAHPSTDVPKTQNSRITGSLQYMSPEQLQLQPVDARSDLYSLGVLLYELYSGVKAFPAQSLQEILQARKRNDVVPLSEICHDLPGRIATIVEKCMEVDPEKRYQSAHALFNDFYKTYRKKTHIYPEKIIERYLLGDKLNNIKPAHDIPYYLKTAGIALIPFALFITLFLYVNSRSGAAVPGFVALLRRPVVDAPPVTRNSPDATSRVEPVHQTVAPVLPGVPSAGKTVKKPAIPAGKRSPASKPPSSGTHVSKERNAAPLDDESILTELKHLIAVGKISMATRMVERYTIDDGEFHLLRAELFIKKQLWAAAGREADMALKVPAQRVQAQQVREEVMYIKARALTAEFDVDHDTQKGRSAMEAWFDLKYHYRVNTSHPRYSMADAEIRRISAAL